MDPFEQLHISPRNSLLCIKKVQDGGAEPPASDRYQLLCSGADMLVLRRCDRNKESRQRLLLAGEIVSAVSVLEAINTIANNGWRGVLSIVSTEASRSFRIENGALKNATSTATSERLGEVMLALGILSQAQHARCLAAVDRVQSKRFGEMALQLGYVTNEKSFHAVCHQALRIFQNALLVQDGFFTFVESPEGNAGMDMSVHLSLQGLLMKSVQRIDEMALYRREVPSGELCPVLTDQIAAPDLQWPYDKIAHLCDGHHSILDIAARLNTDEFTVTKAVAKLMEAGALRLQDRPTLDAVQAAPLIDALNRVLRCVRSRVEQSGGRDNMSWTLEAWMRDTPLSKFFGETLSDAGEVSLDETLQRVGALSLPRPLHELNQAVHELASFAMFSASPVLSRAEQERLAKEVDEALSPLRTRESLRPVPEDWQDAPAERDERPETQSLSLGADVR